MASTPATKKQPRATVIVVTHNSAKWIRPCLDAILAQRLDGGFEVLVVDTESTDQTPSIVARHYRSVKWIPTKNRGFGAANNVGVAKARGDIVAFANPDTVAEPHWLEELIAPLERPNIVTTSQVLLADEPDRINTVGLDLHFLGFSFVRDYRAPAITGEPRHVPGFSGAAFAMRRTDYQRLGGFDENIFLYGEDAELSWRLQKNNFVVLAVPASRIRHDYRPRLDAGKLYHLERSRQYLLRKHLTRPKRILFAPSRLAARLLVNIFARKLGPEARAEVRKGRAEGHDIPIGKPTKSTLRFARTTIPFRRAFPQQATARRLGFLPNLLFLLNRPVPARPRSHP